MVTVELLKSYCLPFMLYVVNAISLSSVNVRILENCINRVMFSVFGSCDRDSLEHIGLKVCIKLVNVNDFIERKCRKFVD